MINQKINPEDIKSMIKLDGIKYDIKLLINKCSDLDSKIKNNDKNLTEQEFRAELTILNQKINQVESNCNNNRTNQDNNNEDGNKMTNSIINRAVSSFGYKSLNNFQTMYKKRDKSPESA